MEQLEVFTNDVGLASCAYCGALPTTRDHVPSRVLLDKPYPDNLPVVPSCRACNERVSLDEAYLACLIDCVLSGSASASDVPREKVRNLLATKPKLAQRLASSQEQRQGQTLFRVEDKRVRNVVVKLARGHAHYELANPQLKPPVTIRIGLLPLLDSQARARFEFECPLGLWPEVGSRGLERAARTDSPQWVIVQLNRYRYLATSGWKQVEVRMVLSEYVACQVAWSDKEI